jgi:hypothetical protein
MDAQKNFSNDFSDHNKMPFVSSFLAEAILFLNENSVTWIHGHVEKETKRKNSQNDMERMKHSV